MPDIHIKLKKLHDPQLLVKAEARRWNVLNAGRQWGKNVFGEDVAVEKLLESRPDNPKSVGWHSPTYKSLQESWRSMRRILQPLTKSASTEEHRIELINGGVLEMWSLDTPDASRGRAYARVIFDEAAVVGPLIEAWDFVIRPTLLYQRGDAWWLSTPRGHNDFWKLWMRGQDPLFKDWKSWTFPTATNPHISEDEIEEARLSMPERRFAQEYLAMFIDDAGEVFRGLDKVCILQEQAPKPGHTYVMSLDWGKVNDFTIVCVLDSTTSEQVYMDRFNKVNYTFQLERVKIAYHRYKPAVVLAETNAMGEANIDRLRSDGIPVRGWTATSPAKNKAVEELSLDIEQQGITLLDDIIQKGELLAFSASKTIGGFVRYAAPSNEHDDTVMALVIARQAMGKGLPAPVPGHDPFASLTGTHGRGDHIELITDPETGKTRFGIPKKAKNFLSFMRGKEE